jgi:hypothetical protein
MKNKKKLSPTTITTLIITITIVLTSIHSYSKNKVRLENSPLIPTTSQQSQQTNQSTIQDEPMVYTQENDQDSTIYPEYLHYVNSQANFTVDYPSYLTRTEYYPEGKEGAGIPPAKNVYFCKTSLDTSKLDFTTNKQSCIGEGFRIQFTQYPGWGGGCEPENHDTLTMMGNYAGYCNYPTGFGQLYYGRPHGEENNDKYNPYEFLITGTYGDSLTNADIKQIMGTFQVSD